MNNSALAAIRDEIKARVPLAAMVERRARLVRDGRDFVACCPFHGERTPSFRVYSQDQHFHCFGCGAHGDVIDFVMKAEGLTWRDAVERLAADTGAAVAHAAGLPPPVARDDAEGATKTAARIARAVALYAEAAPGGSRVEAYLHARLGRLAAVPEVLRFHPACPRRRDDGAEIERLPAMLAPLSDPVTGEQVGTHCTFLRPDYRGKIEHGEAKKVRGTWGVVRLVPDEELTCYGLGVCEGIETGLAIINHAGWLHIWAAGCAGVMRKLPVRPGIAALTLFPDMDDKGAGRDAAKVCAERWLAAGREVQIWWPPGGKDWRDALVPGGSQ